MLKTSNAPVAIVSKETIRNNLTAWTSLMPKVPAYYAVKSCPNQVVLNEMAKNGYYFDVSSIDEIDKVALADPARCCDMIYTNPCRTFQEFDYAIQHGITIFTVDDIAELHKLNRHAATYGNQLDVMLRIPGDEQDSIIKLNTKFGFTGEIPQLVAEWLSTPYLTFKGVSFHVGSKCNNWRSYQKSIDRADKIIKQVTQLHSNSKLSNCLLAEDLLIDIGGGYRDFNDVQNIVNHVKFPRGYHYLAEPGRLFSSNLVTLLTRVKAVRRRDDGIQVTINDSIYGSFSGIKHDAFVPPEPRVVDQYGIETLTTGRPIEKVTYVGQSCDGNDIIGTFYTDRIPTEDSIIIWSNMGSYSLASASEFNGFPKAIVLS